jgi:hypothetical protein
MVKPTLLMMIRFMLFGRLSRLRKGLELRLILMDQLKR